MNNSRVRFADRIVALLMAFMLLLGVLPVNVLASAEGYEGYYTFSVIDSSNQEPVTEATVTYSFSVSGIAEPIMGNAVTDTKGVAAVDLSAYAEAVSDDIPAQLDYNVKMEGYEDIRPENPVSISSVYGDIIVEMNKAEEEPPVISEQVTVTVNAGKNGKVTLNGEASSLTVDSGTEVEIRVEANEGYMISTLSIDDEDAEISDSSLFSTSVNVNADMTVTATFAKAYTVSVSYNGEYGTVNADPGLKEGSITAAYGTKIKMTAVPNENCRVSNVFINGKPDKRFSGNNSEAYEFQEITLARDYEINIEFAPNIYKIITIAPAGGTISSDKDTVDHGESCVVTITPNSGYTIGEVTVNRQPAQISSYINGAAVVVIDAVTEDTTVNATFNDIEGASRTDITLPDDALRVEGNTYVYKKGAEFTISTVKDRIRVYDQDGTIHEASENILTLSAPINITKAELYYKAEGDLVSEWHVVEDLPIIVFAVDDNEPEIYFTSDKANSNGYYSSDVNVTIKVEDKETYSGLESVEYWITDGIKTSDSVTLYKCDDKEIRNTFETTIKVNSTEFNSDSVLVHVKATDRAGRPADSDCPLKINSTEPTAEIEIIPTSKPEARDGYYEAVQARITYTDRASTFDETAALNGLTITAEPKVVISKNAMVTWEHDGDEHIATVVFPDDGNYTMSVSYTNKAGKSLNKETQEKTYSFTKDATSPRVKIVLEESVWENIVSILTFGLWKNHEVTVSAEGKDATSGLNEPLYYEYNGTEALSAEKLAELYGEGQFSAEEVTVNADKAFVVYARVSDYAGNAVYVSTDGVIVDMSVGNIEAEPTEQPNEYGYYNKDVTINVTVTDSIAADKSFSGISFLKYTIEVDGDKKPENTLYEYKEGEDRLSSFSDTIFIDAEVYNADSVRVIISAGDLAGNSFDDKVVALSTNTDAPTAVVRFNDKSNRMEEGYGYYGQERTATVTLTDRAMSFDGEAVHFICEPLKKSNPGEEIEEPIIISDWVSDGDTHTATVTFAADGAYTWGIEYTDKAGNALETVTVDENESPWSFTVDKTKPYGTVTIEENTWNRLLETITFGLYSSETVVVNAEGGDITSPVIVEYLETDRVTPMTEEELDKEEFYSFDAPYPIEDDRRVVVYARITDYAGNYIYVSSDGYIIDKSKGVVSLAVDEKKEIYNDNVLVHVYVSDIAKDSLSDSGIKTIVYTVTADGKETETGTLYTFETDAPSYDDLKHVYDGDEEKNGNILINAAANNADDVVVTVMAEDNAGNPYFGSLPLAISVDKPTAEIVFNDKANRTENGYGYYGQERTATITFIDREIAFDKEAVNITWERDKSNPDEKLEESVIISDWVSDGDTHTATVTFAADGAYIWGIEYTDKAGNTLEQFAAVENESPWSFTVDKTKPYGTVTIEKNTWNRLLEAITFGLYSRETVTVDVTGDDITSPVIVEYFETDKVTPMTEEELDKEKFNTFDGSYPIEDDRRVVVYARITDYAGNYIYVSSDGYIIDKSEGVVTLSVDENKEIYNDNVLVHVDVSDVAEDSLSDSGIKTIVYTITSDGKETETGTLYTFEEDAPSYDDLKHVYDGDEEENGNILVNASANNADSVVVTVVAEDNAGNKYDSTLELAISIDKPTAKIVFNDTANRTENGYGYYGQKRTATITLVDREIAFDEDAVNITWERGKPNSDEKLEESVIISDWVSDGDTHTATVTFAADGAYTWGIEYTDRAGNALEAVTVDENESPWSFTVDKTKPYCTVTIEENVWSVLLETITFGLYKSSIAHVSADAGDLTSPVEIGFYEYDGTEALTAAELNEVSFRPFEEEYEIDSDRHVVVYLKVTDYAGNYTYVSSDGYIVDTVPVVISLEPVAKEVIYNHEYKTVDITVTAEDPETYSGIREITYRVQRTERNGNIIVTQSGTLYKFDYTRDDVENSNGGELTISGEGLETTSNKGTIPEYGQLLQSFTGTISVDTGLNNSSDVVVYVNAVDNAGNVSEEASLSLDIDVTSPTVSVTFDNNKDNGGNTYFDRQRTATVVITERANHFDPEAARTGIISAINAVDAAGENISDAFAISEWTTRENSANPDKDTHTATVFFEKDANFEWYVSYTDKAGNASGEAIAGKDDVAPWKFTVDTTIPYGTVTAARNAGASRTWNVLANPITFGFWANQWISITGTSGDDTSPVAAVDYYKVSARKVQEIRGAMTADELDGLKSSDWQPFAEVRADVEKDGEHQFIVYIRITDMAGNYTYISTDGLIVDRTAPVEEIAPEITITPPQPINGLYNGDVAVKIEVEDPEVNGPYSGLSNVRYEVLNMGEGTQEGNESFSKESPAWNDLRQKWEYTLNVSSVLNNSNDVVIRVYAEDNAGNSSSKDESIKIDITPPNVSVSYDNNSADSEKYFKENRTATIVVTERNFDPNDVKATITNTDGGVPSVNGWSMSEGSGNGDNTRWTATVTYSSDGDYTFGIDYTDMAANHCTDPQYSGTAPRDFTIDKTVPVINVSYNNNSVQNDRYFAKARVATVTITEHNFDVSRVEFIQTTNGGSIPSPSWSASGDTHTATLNYSTDGGYTIDVKATDMAGNVSGTTNFGSSAAAKDFVIDQTIEKPVIGGIEDGKAYKNEVVPTVSFSDTNFDSYEIKLLRTRKGEKNVDITSDIAKLVSTNSQGGSGTFDIFPKTMTVDGIYDLSVKLTDRAGNEETQTARFTVNRYGSVYEYSDYLISLIENGGSYVGSVDEDLVITEYNADKLVENSLDIEITKDGKPLDEVIYDVSPVINDRVTVGTSGWYQYQYTISKDNFASDGVYKVSVSTKDATGNMPENDNYEDMGILFRVDSTVPEITSVIGLEKSIINAHQVTVKYTVYDTIGLEYIKVLVDNRQVGETITDFGDDVNNYSGSFILDESSSIQTIRIVVQDLAGNITDTLANSFKSAYEFNSAVTVSTNALVRWYANKGLFWGSIGGFSGLGAAAVAFIAAKRRKKEE